MIPQLWVSESRKSILCVDSYDEGVLKGRFYNPYQDVASFSSLTQFLIKMETLLDEMQMPQAYTEQRKFSMLLQPERDDVTSASVRKGVKATFELQVLFRQHSSWQGVIVWREQKTEHSFRSVLELIFLIDSALRSLEGSGDA